MSTIYKVKEDVLPLCETQRLLASNANLCALFAQLERMNGLLQRYLHQLQEREDDKHDMQSFLVTPEAYEQRMGRGCRIGHLLKARR